MTSLFRNNKLALISVVVIAVFVLTALLAPIIAPYESGRG